MIERPLTGGIGVELEGLDLTQPISDDYRGQRREMYRIAFRSSGIPVRRGN